MGDVRIEQLHITVEVGADEGDETFTALFNAHIRRWHERQQQRRADRHFAEDERRHPRDREATWSP